jgi:2-iminoacetate synthase
MDLAKPGDIKQLCDPNGLSTFLEYLLDYASPETRAVGERTIADALAGMDDWSRERSLELMSKVQAGQRDVYC